MLVLKRFQMLRALTKVVFLFMLIKRFDQLANNEH